MLISMHFHNLAFALAFHTRGLYETVLQTALSLKIIHTMIADHGRPLFISERILAKDLDNGISPASILGLLENMKSKDPMGESVSNVDVSSMDAQTVVEQHMHKSRHKVKSGMHPSPSVEEIDNVPEYFEFGEKLRKLFPSARTDTLIRWRSCPDCLLVHEDLLNSELQCFKRARLVFEKRSLCLLQYQSCVLAS